MRKGAISLVLLAFMSIACGAQTWTSSDLAGLETYKIVGKSSYYQKLVQSFGAIYVAYKYGGVSFDNSLDEYINAFDYAFIFAKKDNTVTVLGKIEKARVLDAFGKVIYDLSKEDATLFPHVIGISSSLLQTLTQVSVVARMNDSTAENPAYYETESVVSLTFDAKKKTIVRYISGY